MCDEVFEIGSKNLSTQPVRGLVSQRRTSWILAHVTDDPCMRAKVGEGWVSLALTPQDVTLYPHPSLEVEFKVACATLPPLALTTKSCTYMVSWIRAPWPETD